jgi:hypothetical protein
LKQERWDGRQWKNATKTLFGKNQFESSGVDGSVILINVSGKFCANNVHWNTMGYDRVHGGTLRELRRILGFHAESTAQMKLLTRVRHTKLL